MLKLVGMIFIIGACSAVGLKAGRRLTLRIEALNEWISALEIMRAEITMKRTPLGEIITLLEARQGLLAPVFTLIREESQKNFFTAAWKHALALSCELGLTEEDAAHLRSLGATLGRYDAEEQDTAIRYCKTRLEHALGMAISDRESKGRAYRGMGVALGVIFVLVII